MENVVPIGVKRQTQWIEVAVASAWGGAGELISSSTDSTSATLRNIGAWPFEYRIDAGPWTRLELRNSIQLDVSLATTAIRLRKSEFGGVSAAQLEINSLTAEYVADGRVVELGGTGATSFTDLIDAPATIVPLATLRGDASGQGIEFVSAESPYAVGAMHLEPAYQQDVAAVNCVDSPLFSFSLWVNLRNGAGQRPVYTFDPDGGAFTFMALAEGRLHVGFGLVDGSKFFDFTADSVMSQNEWHHILGSVKCDEATGEKVVALYFDDVNMPVTVGYDQGGAFAPELNGLPLRVGGYPNEGAEIDLAEFWLAVGQTLLVDGEIPEATRRMFIDSNGWPVDLGASGATPTGTAPTVFLRLPHDSGTGFIANLGTGGGPFIPGEEGEMTPAPHRPSDPPRTFTNPMFKRNDLIVGGSYGAPGRVPAPPSTGTWVLHCIDNTMTWVEVV